MKKIKSLVVLSFSLLLLFSGCAKTPTEKCDSIDKQYVYVDKKNNIESLLIPKGLLYYLSNEYCNSTTKTKQNCKDSIIDSYGKNFYLINPSVDKKIKTESVITKEYINSIDRKTLDDEIIYTPNIKEIKIYNVIVDDYYLNKRGLFFEKILDDIKQFKDKNTYSNIDTE